MWEILLLVVVVGGISRLAASRGGSPWLFGALAVGTWAIATLVGTLLATNLAAGTPTLSSIAAQMGAMGLPWLSLGALAVMVRFVVARGRVQPPAPWICPTCRWVNPVYAVECEACKRSFDAPRDEPLREG